MERLRRAMGLEFDWFDAIDTADPRVFEIRERVRWAREESRKGVESVVPDLNFAWSDEVEKMLKESVPDEPVGGSRVGLSLHDDPRYARLPPLPPVPNLDTRKPLYHLG
ncbi:hypothetical protein FRC09_010475, partial [Ceratobasidium sp. 395]